MELGITIPLQKHLKLSKPDYGGFADPLFCWDLHIIRYQKKAALVVVNTGSRFICIMAGMMAKDWKNLAATAEEAIRAGFVSEGYTKEQIERYFALAGKSIITKTHGRRSVAGLNRDVEYLYYIAEPIDESGLYQAYHSAEINDLPFRPAGAHSAVTPRGLLLRDMKRAGVL